MEASTEQDQNQEPTAQATKSCLEPPSFYVKKPDGSYDFTPHRGQFAAINSKSRFILLLAGTQSGKTVVGPLWLWNEIGRLGPGDYLCVAPSYPLMQKKMLPEFQRLFSTIGRAGEYRSSDRIFQFYKSETKVFFGHADDPESLEAATAKAAWLDEAGQNRFRVGSWEAILRRLSIHQGRILITTTPYNLGWLKQRLYDPWISANRSHPEIDVINFDSIANPAFPRAEYERARRDLPPWRFNMFYRGLFERPAGLIYDCFDVAKHVVAPFLIPPTWQRYLGLDFGGVNTAGVFLANKPGTKELFLYREYKAGGRTAKQHAAALLAGEPVPAPQSGSRPLICVGGSKSEGQWRNEFTAGGLFVNEPPVSEVKSVEVGINQVYGLLARNELRVFATCAGWLDEVQSYSRELDESGEPTEKIEDKETFHSLDATRYVASWLTRARVSVPPPPVRYRL